jgi:hypothetical protein
MLKIVTFLAVGALAFPVSLLGQAAPGARSHDGFFLRFLVGGGPASVEVAEVLGQTMTLSSPSGGLFHFQIGGAISENLVAFADLGGFSIVEPDVEWGSSTATVQEADVTTSGFGAGLSYYVMPMNLYVSGSLLMTRDRLTFQDTSGDTEAGLGVLLVVGKEWWVGDRWGLGAALFMEAATLKDQADETGYQADIRNGIVGLAFTATLN